MNIDERMNGDGRLCKHYARRDSYRFNSVGGSHFVVSENYICDGD